MITQYGIFLVDNTDTNKEKFTRWESKDKLAIRKEGISDDDYDENNIEHHTTSPDTKHVGYTLIEPIADIRYPKSQVFHNGKWNETETIDYESHTGGWGLNGSVWEWSIEVFSGVAYWIGTHGGQLDKPLAVQADDLKDGVGFRLATFRQIINFMNNREFNLSDEREHYIASLRSHRIESATADQHHKNNEILKFIEGGEVIDAKEKHDMNDALYVQHRDRHAAMQQATNLCLALETFLEPVHLAETPGQIFAAASAFLKRFRNRARMISASHENLVLAITNHIRSGRESQREPSDFNRFSTTDIRKVLADHDAINSGPLGQSNDDWGFGFMERPSDEEIREGEKWLQQFSQGD